MKASGGIVCTGVIDGDNGYSTVVVQLFRRSATALDDNDRPNGTLTYNFSSGILRNSRGQTSGNGFNGWSQTVPAADSGTTLYVTMATARSLDSEDEILSNEWSTPTEYVVDGMNSAPVVIYKRSAGQPTDKPADGCEYTFATGVLSGTLNGWSTEIPAHNGYPCWVRHATAANYTDKDTINASEWSDPAVKFVEDGKDAVQLTIDNQHEDFLYDGNNLVAPNGGATAPLHLYDGPTEKTSEVSEWRINDTDNDAEANWKTSVNTNANASINTSTGVLTISGLIAGSVKIRVRAKYKNLPYYSEFTGNKTNQDKYDIILTPNSIAYNNANYQTQRIQVSATGIGMGGTKLTPSINLGQGSDNLRVFWSYVTIVNGNTVIGTPQRLLSNPYKDVTADECSANVGIYFELRWYNNPSAQDSSTDYRICDYETIEIAKVTNGSQGPQGEQGPQGDNGDDALYTVDEYARSNSRASYAPQNIDRYAFSNNSPIDNQPGWGSPAPSATDNYPYIWKRSIVYNPNTGEYDQSTLTYVCLTGRDGQQGQQGDTIWEAKAYKAIRGSIGSDKPTVLGSAQSPITPQTTDFGNYWQSTPPTKPSKQISGYTLKEVSTTSGMTSFGSNGSYILYGNGIHNGLIRKRVEFTAAAATRIKITVMPSSESYDRAYVGNLDQSYSTAMLTTSGSTEVSAEVAISAGTHYFEIAYSKDSSVNTGNDLAAFQFVEAVGGRIYVSVATVENGIIAASPGWSTPVPFDGEDGQRGGEGLQGCVIRTSEWKSGVDYCNDEGDDEVEIGYIDVVAIENSSAAEGYDFYRCKSSHTASNTNKPGSGSSWSTYWEALEDVGPIYTSFLVAKNAFIKFGTGNQFVITDSSGKIKAGMKGDGNIRMWAGSSANMSDITSGSNNDNPVNDSPFQVYNDGSVKMTNADVAGTIRATNLFRKVCFVSDEGAYSTGGSNTGSADLVFLVPTGSSKWTYNQTSKGTVYIPNPEDYQGKTIEIRHTLAPSGSDQARIMTTDESTHFILGIYYSNGSFTTSSYNSSIMIDYNTTVVLQSVKIGSTWYWLKIET